MFFSCEGRSLGLTARCVADTVRVLPCFVMDCVICREHKSTFLPSCVLFPCPLVPLTWVEGAGEKASTPNPVRSKLVHPSSRCREGKGVEEILEWW